MTRSLAIALPGLHHVDRGAETAMEAVARQLAVESGWSVTVFGMGPPRSATPYEYIRIPCPDIAHFARRPSLPLFRTPAQWQELVFARGLRRVLKRRRFDVSLACSWPWTHFALRDSSRRHAFWTQNGDHMVAARHAEYVAFVCDGLICTNPDYFDRHRQRYHSLLAPNGVDPAVFTPATTPPQGRPEVLVVSALTEHKRIDRAVVAVAALPDARLTLCGRGPDANRLDELAGKLLGPGRYRRIAVPRDQMPGVYHDAHVLLHPCDTEPSANVWSEALASGLPVVAHDMPVTRWVLGPHGLLCDARDPGELLRATSNALRLATDPALRHRRHHDAAARLSWAASAGAISNFLTGLLPEPACSRSAALPRTLGVVVIGRNEGQRLRRCLASLPAAGAGGGLALPVVYVDSGSVDGSVALAESMHARAVSLDPRQPFTAARARNAGVSQLRRDHPHLKHVLFLDGDTELLAGFIDGALPAFQTDRPGPPSAAVAGRRRERFPADSVYNRLCDMEWNTPPGPASAVGGDAIYSLDALAAIADRQGHAFLDSLIAGEEPELALRLQQAGYSLLRVPVDMTLHDADMHRFGQWWRRQRRAGHAYAEGHFLHPPAFRARELRSIAVWGLVGPSLLLISAALAVVSPVARLVLGLLLASHALLFARITCSRLARGDSLRHSAVYAAFTLLGKLPQFLGTAGFHISRLLGRHQGLIEYKPPLPERGEAVRVG